MLIAMHSTLGFSEVFSTTEKEEKYEVCTVSYSVPHLRKKEENRGELHGRIGLTKAVNVEIERLKKETGKDWRVISISTTMVRENLVITVLFESCS